MPDFSCGANAPEFSEKIFSEKTENFRARIVIHYIMEYYFNKESFIYSVIFIIYSILYI